MQNELSNCPLASVGEPIDKELGAKMVKDFQDAFPLEIKGYHIGREIIEKILNQPTCVGIRFYNAINESGEKTLVYVGVDEHNDIISEISLVDETGAYARREGIVADRITTVPNDDPNKITSWFS